MHTDSIQLNVKQVSSKDKKGVESLCLRGRQKKDMDDMDDLWGEAFADTGVDEEDAEQKKNKKDKGCSDCPPRPVQYPAPVIALVPKMAASSSTPQASPKMAASSSTAASNDNWLNNMVYHKDWEGSAWHNDPVDDARLRLWKCCGVFTSLNRETGNLEVREEWRSTSLTKLKPLTTEDSEEQPKSGKKRKAGEVDPGSFE